MATDSLRLEDTQSNRSQSYFHRLHICSSVFYLVGLILFWGVYTLPLSLLSWACVKFGERKHGDALLCASRLSQPKGFAGNADFYGFGIRLGIYFQWLALLVANVFLPGERRAVAGAYAASSVAVLVATYLLVFQQQCTFTVEMIVILNILWGGFYITSPPPEIGEADQGKTRAHGLGFVRFQFYIMSIPVTAWFWLRLASVGQIDFVPTPGGTSFALLSHVRPDGIGAASKFMAFLCLWLSSTFIPRSNQGFFELFEPKGIGRSLRTINSWLYNFTRFRAIGLLLRLFYASVTRLGSIVARVMKKTEQFEQWSSKDPFEYMDNLDSKWVVCFSSLIVLIVDVVSTELTLHWNHVGGIYEVASTGQIIPLVVGIGSMIAVIWKLKTLRKVSTAEEPTQTIEEGPMQMIEEGPTQTIEEGPMQTIREEPMQTIREEPMQTMEEESMQMIGFQRGDSKWR